MVARRVDDRADHLESSARRRAARARASLPALASASMLRLRSAPTTRATRRSCAGGSRAASTANAVRTPEGEGRHRRSPARPSAGPLHFQSGSVDSRCRGGKLFPWGGRATPCRPEKGLAGRGVTPDARQALCRAGPRYPAPCGRSAPKRILVSVIAAAIAIPLSPRRNLRSTGCASDDRLRCHCRRSCRSARAGSGDVQYLRLSRSVVSAAGRFLALTFVRLMTDEQFTQASTRQTLTAMFPKVPIRVGMTAAQYREEFDRSEYAESFALTSRQTSTSFATGSARSALRPMPLLRERRRGSD